MTPDEQERLTRVGPGTPMGGLLRRYWIPVAASAEVAPGCALETRVLGEDLAVFRTTGGDLGLLSAACPHRGASLAHGFADADALRCPYHGWAFAPDGACVAMPAEDVSPALAERGRARAYRVAELGGFVFGYLGPEPAPLLPRYDLFVWEGVLRDIGRALVPCNWLQIMENSVDPVHVEWLHGHHLAQVRRRRGLPEPARYRRRQVEVGFDVFEHGILKRRVLEGGSREDDDWRVGHPLVFPIMVRVGVGMQHRFQIRVPVDDTHTRHYWYSCYRPPAGVAPAESEEVPVYEVPWRDERGGYRLDFVDGGDVMAWVSQGPIADRTREHLVASDRGIVLLRRLLVEQLERLERGLDPLGVVRDPRANTVIELPQEREKFGAGAAFLREAVELSHVRFSPLREQILAWLDVEEAGARTAPTTGPDAVGG